MNDFLPYIYAVTKSFPKCWQEDLVQEGLIGLYSACNSFDDKTYSDFNRYAKVCIKNKIIDAYRTLSKDSDAVNIDDENISALEENGSSRLEAKEFFEHLRKNLSELENKVLDGYLERQSYAKIASNLGVSEKTVDNAILRIRRKIKKHYF